MENQTEFIMTDETIAQIAKVLQVAILTGTDIVDNLRTVRFNVNNDKLQISARYAEEFNSNLQAMIDELNSASE